MVENKTTGGQLPAPLKNKFRDSKPKNYFEALNLLEEYTAEHRIKIPDAIQLAAPSHSYNNITSRLENRSVRADSELLSRQNLALAPGLPANTLQVGSSNLTSVQQMSPQPQQLSSPPPAHHHTQVVKSSSVPVTSFGYQQPISSPIANQHHHHHHQIFNRQIPFQFNQPQTGSFQSYERNGGYKLQIAPQQVPSQSIGYQPSSQPIAYIQSPRSSQQPPQQIPIKSSQHFGSTQSYQQ